MSPEKTYKPRSNLVVSVLYLFFLFFLFIGLWSSSKLDLVGRVLVSGGLAFLVFLFVRLAKIGITTSDRGVRVVNTFETFELDWRQIKRFRVGRWRIRPYVCLVDLIDGSTKPILVYQERLNFPNGPAKQGAAELNAELSSRSAPPKTTAQVARR